MSTPIPAPVRREVMARYGLEPGGTLPITCHYCPAETTAYWPLGKRGMPSYWPMLGRGFSLDHVHPQAHGGTHEESNLVIACIPCNTRKRDRISVVGAE